MTLLLALILPASVFALPPYSYTNYEFAVDGIYYKIVDNEACVTYQEYRSGMHLSDYHGDVVIPAQVTYQDVTYPVTTIDYYAFNYCQGLTSITIPESITAIKDNAFYLCTRLTCVNLLTPTVVIERYAFSMCSALTTITCPLTTPPAMYYEECFDSYESATLYVPASAVDSYRNAPVWKKFVHIQAIDNQPGDEPGYEYVPFVREGVKWTYSIQEYHYEEDYLTNPARGDNVVYRTLEIKGDTVINGKTYKAVHMCTDDVYSEPKDVVPVYLREEDKMVYGIVPDSTFYDDALVCTTPFCFPQSDVTYSGEEFLLYDFQDMVAYWDNLLIDNSLQLQLDTVQVGGHYAKRYFDSRQEWDHFQVIEGIGATGMNSYPLAFLMPTSPGIHTDEYYSLEKVVENGEVIYPQNYVEDRYQPVIREGVKWVNVHVVINDGDTTKNYYTYEFKGNYPELDSHDRVFKAVYSRNSDAKGDGTGDERLVAGLREDEACILSFRNEPLSVVDHLINFYFFYGNGNVCLLHENLQGMWDINYYINSQTDPEKRFLNTDNFVKADPIEIDGMRCSRIAYIGEHGDTLAYLVEGIGFDSRDFGDLLTPFTHYPEASANHQEYCGLSHVIKDGQIIYKGMLYDPNATTGIPGDINGDGEVNIGDANSVIDIVVMGGNNGHTRIPAADMNGDNEITIADFNAIIAIILKQQRE